MRVGARLKRSGGVQSREREECMAKSFMDMVREAQQQVERISPEEAHKRTQENPDTLIIDVREPDDIASTGAIPGSINVPLGVLAIKADQELPEQYRNPQLQDRSRPIITTCGGGGQAALAAKTLKDMGFTSISTIDGGTIAWKNAGLATEQQ